MLKIYLSYIPAVILIIWNAILMFQKGGIFGNICGVIWVGVWGTLAYWDWCNLKIEKEHERMLQELQDFDSDVLQD